MSESKSAGVYLDYDTGKITRTQPNRAKVLVQPGHKVSPAVQELLGDEQEPKPAAKKPPAKKGD